MKKNRNCGGTMYPNFSQAMPIMGVPAPMTPPQAYAQSYSAPTNLHHMRKHIINHIIMLSNKSIICNNKLIV